MRPHARVPAHPRPRARVPARPHARAQPRPRTSAPARPRARASLGRTSSQQPEKRVRLLAPTDDVEVRRRLCIWSRAREKLFCLFCRPVLSKSTSMPASSRCGVFVVSLFVLRLSLLCMVLVFQISLFLLCVDPILVSGPVPRYPLFVSVSIRLPVPPPSLSSVSVPSSVCPSTSIFCDLYG